MVRIMLACAAGMSTSLLVTKMEKAAADAGVEAKIWAVPESEVEKNIGEFDILLVGPQIRFKAKAFEKMSAGRFPVHVIDMRDYGTMNGGKVFATAMEILGK
ncbi:Lichenan-specific phosphotransferase enzyme IIB component [Clostridiales bacterium CHKCI006]|uniref:PTS sugar transporter subunit IIB n=1 Tax=Candidatus Fimiplasma intestinipullorum TaxID=2840825 RepID=A0A9D1HNN2_9FIRM|nr:Lichenan-specific phosphotransferase enzyme IIB component [Clostridiales bacterium CHKCI006]HIU12649.1 PTS sugar transporter subunit IIB [Candidatus Fimiplasma intestinipullorum]